MFLPQATNSALQMLKNAKLSGLMGIVDPKSGPLDVHRLCNQIRFKRALLRTAPKTGSRKFNFMHFWPFLAPNGPWSFDRARTPTEPSISAAGGRTIKKGVVSKKLHNKSPLLVRSPGPATRHQCCFAAQNCRGGGRGSKGLQTIAGGPNTVAW